MPPETYTSDTSASIASKSRNSFSKEQNEEISNSSFQMRKAKRKKKVRRRIRMKMGGASSMSHTIAVSPRVPNSLSPPVLTPEMEERMTLQHQLQQSRLKTGNFGSKNGSHHSLASMQHYAPLINPAQQYYPPSNENLSTMSSTLSPTSSFYQQHQQQQQFVHQNSRSQLYPKRRCIELRLEEEGKRENLSNLRLRSLFKSLRTKSQPLIHSAENILQTNLHAVDNGDSNAHQDDLDVIRVSWYDGTNTAELQSHVTNALSRKVGKAIMDYRIVCLETLEEIVLTPHIPHCSKFLVKYTLPPPIQTVYDYSSKAPYSPSRALSPVPSDSEAKPHEFNLNNTDHSQADVPHYQVDSNGIYRKLHNTPNTVNFDNHNFQTPNSDAKQTTSLPPSTLEKEHSRPQQVPPNKPRSRSISNSTPQPTQNEIPPIVVLKPTKYQHFKHNLFVISNYFLLFLSIIALFAEIYERSPKWIEALRNHLDQVHSCAVDRDSLFECVSNGDVSGLVASFFIWITSKVKTSRHVFLFGFDSVQKLWTVFYEALVSSFCWGVSYIFIRRGLNPDTRTNFLAKYWKDSLYGILANFIQNFIKTVMKNLIPKESVEEAFQEAMANANTRKKFGFLEALLAPFNHHNNDHGGSSSTNTANIAVNADSVE